jgi:hypothetical protein
MRDACELIAKMFNILEVKNRSDWQGLDIFNASPTGELSHVYDYYPVAKEFFDYKFIYVNTKSDLPNVGEIQRFYKVKDSDERFVWDDDSKEYLKVII